MTLKEKLEILRGEPIEVRTVKPEDIPCIETSDAEKLCKNPVVSVHMITYNHEPYIRQAIEGVMMQKTDFEFELIVGEDCSQDKTREICFECQKKYPDKIRVLWWHENVSKLGGNGHRVMAQCRGEFIAFCEGDDYWTDPLKLQKQVDLLRANPNVVLCFARAKVLNVETGFIIDESSSTPLKGAMRGEEFSKSRLFEFVENISTTPISNASTRTLTAMFRSSVAHDMYKKFNEIFSYALWLGDTTAWLGCSYFGDVYFMDDIVGVYRRHHGGVTQRNPGGLHRDGVIVRIFYMMKMWGLTWEECISVYKDPIFTGWMMDAQFLSKERQKELSTKLSKLREKFTLKGHRYGIYIYFLKRGLLRVVTKRICDFVFYHSGQRSVLLDESLLRWQKTN